MPPLSPVPQQSLAEIATGLRACLRLRGGRVVARIGLDELGVPPGPGEWTWVHVDLVDPGLGAALRRVALLPEEAFALLDSLEGPPRVECDEIGLHGLLPDFEARPQPDEKHMASLRFVLTGTVLLTGRRHPLHATGTLLRRIEARTDLDTPEAAIEAQVEAFAAMVHEMAVATSSVLDRFEDSLLGGGAIDRARLQRERRRLVRLLRRTAPLRDALAEHAERLPGAQRPVARIASELEGLSDRARLLHEDLMGRIAEETNHRLYVISMISALLVPPTLVTGFFGMNTGGLPFADSALGTAAAALLAALACGAAAWLLLRRR